MEPSCLQKTSYSLLLRLYEAERPSPCCKQFSIRELSWISDDSLRLFWILAG